MARGWESKSVEEQQAEAAAPKPKNRPVSPEQVAKQQKRLGLTMSRNRVRQQLDVAQNPTHRQMLERALADLEQQLAHLD